jgi:phage baseplate assembly protein W
MGIANTSATDYTGRKKDISILQYPDAAATGPQPVTPAFGKQARFCAGVQKLVQKYLIVLMTNLSSQVYYPEFGTNLLYTLQAGISPTDRLRAGQLFRLASFETVLTLKSYQVDHPEIPDDERIVAANLVDIVLYGGMASFSVSIVTEAGNSLDFLVPLPK